jgi:transposase-like protein
MPKPERRDPTKERYWRRLLRLWQRSGQTGRDFCATHGLSQPSFYAWRREIARRDQEQTAPTKPTPRSVAPHPSAGTPLPTFVEVTVDAGASAPAPLEVVLAHGRRVCVPPGFDAELLRQLLRVLEEPSC